MRTYLITIKSHAEAPDFETGIEAPNRLEAIEKFYDMLHGEFDRDFINRNIEEQQVLTASV